MTMRSKPPSRAKRSDLGLDVARGHFPAWRRARPSLPAESAMRCAGAFEQFRLDLHRRQQRIAQRFDGHVLDDMQQRKARACGLAHSSRARAATRALSRRQVDDCEDALVVDSCRKEITARQAAASAASAANCAGDSVSGRAPGSTPVASQPLRVRRGRAGCCAGSCGAARRPAATSAAYGGGTANRGCGSTVRRATADHTRGGGWKAPGPTSNSFSIGRRGASMTVRRP